MLQTIKAQDIGELLRRLRSCEGADLGEFRGRYHAILDKFYGAPLSERSMVQTYLDILLAAADCAVIMPSEMMLQAKAAITAEALDLVLYPEFKFTEEARPIAARELAKRATPRIILDRIWSGLAEFILLGESPPPGPVTTDEIVEDRRFRRELLRALGYVWAHETESKLKKKQAEIECYTSARYWTDHPELQAAIQTGLGFLRLLNTQMDRSLWASEQDGASSLREPLTSLEQPGLGGSKATDNEGRARYQDFLAKTYDRHGKGRPWTADAQELVAHWEDEAGRLPAPDFWEDKQILRATLTSGMTLLRLLAGQVAQAVEADQVAEATADSETRPGPAKPVQV